MNIDGSTYSANFAAVLNAELEERFRDACNRTFGCERLPGFPTEISSDFDDFANPALILHFENGQTLRIAFEVPFGRTSQ